MIKDIRAEQNILESSFFALQSTVEKQAVALVASGNVGKAALILAQHTEAMAVKTSLAWSSFSDLLITKYKDGFVDTIPGDIHAVGTPVGYPKWWLSAVGFENFPKESPTICSNNTKGMQSSKTEEDVVVVRLNEKVRMLQLEISKLKEERQLA